MERFKDLTGQNFGRWKVIMRVANNKNNNTQWLCECSCENKTQKILSSPVLINSKSKSCGCLKSEIIGKKYGKLKVVEKAENRKNRVVWKCVCDCGNTTLIGTSQLTDKNGRRDCGNCDKNKYIIFDTYIEGLDSQNRSFYFDIDEYDRIKNYRWLVNSDGYVVATINGKSISMQNFILNPDNGYEVDHINGETQNNLKSNLRICTHQENGCNLAIRKDNISGCKGVWWNKKSQKWDAAIGYKNKSIYLGSFVNFDDAVKVRKEAEIQYFKEYIRV